MSRTPLASLVLLFGLSLGARADEGEDLPKDLPAVRDSGMKQQVLHLLRENRAKYGPDAALMQGLFLTHSLQGDAVLTTESTIVGFEKADGRRWVAFRVATGVVFDDRTLDRDRRLERIWHIVLERTLLRYPSFSVPADGVAVEVHYNHRPYRSMEELYAHIDDVGPLERAKFYLPGGELSAFVEHRLAAQQLLEHAQILVDGAPVKLQLVEPEPTPTPGTSPTPGA